MKFAGKRAREKESENLIYAWLKIVNNGKFITQVYEKINANRGLLVLGLYGIQLVTMLGVS